MKQTSLAIYTQSASTTCFSPVLGTSWMDDARFKPEGISPQPTKEQPEMSFVIRLSGIFAGRFGDRFTDSFRRDLWVA